MNMVKPYQFIGIAFDSRMCLAPRAPRIGDTNMTIHLSSRHHHPFHALVSFRDAPERGAGSLTARARSRSRAQQSLDDGDYEAPGRGGSLIAALGMGALTGILGAVAMFWLGLGVLAALAAYSVCGSLGVVAGGLANAALDVRRRNSGYSHREPLTK